MSSVVSNPCPFRTFLSLGNRKKSHGVRSGEYGSCCNWGVPCLAKNCCTRCEVCAGWGSSPHPSIFLVVFSELIHTNVAQPSAISRTVNLLLLWRIVLTLAIISSFLNGDGHPERGSLSAEVLSSSLNRRYQSNTCVRPVASSPYACCNNWYISIAVFLILKQNLMQMRCLVLSHIVKIAMT